MRVAAAVTITCSIISLSIAGDAQAAIKRITDIPAQELGPALEVLATQREFQILYHSDLVDHRATSGARGNLTTDEALQELLAGTGLAYRYLDERSITVYTIAPTPEPRRHGGESPARSGMPGRDGRSTSSARVTAQDSSEPSNLSQRFRFAQATDASSGADENGPMLEEIVVEARLRKERLQDVPASIVTASGETIGSLNAVEVPELSKVAPGLTYVSKPGRFGTGPAVALRGISTFTQSPAIQDSVSTVLDGIPLSRAKSGAFPDLSDIERIEVMRGPQGTLFGKNASAGVISFTTKDPSEMFESSMGVDYSTYDNRIARLAVSGPVGENLQGRLSLYYKERDGFIENIFDGGDWDDDKQRGVRAKLVYRPSDRDTLRVSADFLQQDNDAGTQTVRAFQPNTPQYIRDILMPIVGPENDKINVRPVGDNGQDAGSNTQRAWGAAVQWDHAFADHTLTAIGGYRGWTQDSFSGVYSWYTPLNDGNTIFFYDTRQYSGELRFASSTEGYIDYVAGLFVMSDDIGTGLKDPDPGLAVLSTTGVVTGRQQRNWVNDTETLNYAIFGEADAHMTDRLTLTAGVRGTHEKVDVTITGLPTSPSATRIVVPLGTTKDSESVENLSWRLGARWNFDADRMVYAAASTGFKGPGFNVVSAIAGNAQPVKPEEALSFEAGVKSQFLNRRLMLNLTAFYATYEDFQTQGFVFVGGSTTGQIQLANAGKLRTRGFEAELMAHFGESTDLSLNATHIDGIFKEFRNAQCYTAQPVGPGQCSASGSAGQQDLSGSRLANTPKWAVNVLGKQRFRLAGTSWGGVATLDYSWRSSVRWDVLGSPLGLEGSYGLLGASLGVQSENQNISVKVYGKNLTDQFHTAGITVGQAVTQFVPTDYSRIVGLAAEFLF